MLYNKGIMESPGLNRRDFLRTAFAAGAMSSFPEVAESQQKLKFVEQNIDDLRSTIDWEFLDQVDKVFTVPENHLVDQWGFMFKAFKNHEPVGSTYGYVDEDGRAVIVKEAEWNQDCVEKFEFTDSDQNYRIINISDKNGSDCRVVVHYWKELLLG